MKSLYSLLVLLSITFTSNAQITDTCEWVSQNNDAGGLDCALVSFAPYPVDSFQWLDCQNNFAVIPNDTMIYFSGSITTYSVALVVSAYGCVDTSYCFPVCYYGIEELYANKVGLVKVVDLMGRDTEDKPNTLQIYVYSDGTTEKVFRVE